MGALTGLPVRTLSGFCGTLESKEIFRRFSSEPSQTNGRNTGIGLNLAYEIILKHGGQLELMDHPEEGAWFRLRLYG